MQSKANIYDLESANNEIGQTIHDAKRRLMDAHKKGVPLAEATETFFAEVGNVINRATIRLHGEPVANVSPPEIEPQAPQGHAENWNVEDQITIPPHGSSGVAEIERLVNETLTDGDLSQQLAFLELLTILYHDKSWALTARNAVVKFSTELADDAADLMVATEQKRRRSGKGGAQ